MYVLLSSIYLTVPSLQSNEADSPFSLRSTAALATLVPCSLTLENLFENPQRAYK